MATTVCYLVQSHRDPEQVYRLVRTLRRGSRDGVVAVQHDHPRCRLEWEPLAGLPKTLLLPGYDEPRVRSEFGAQIGVYLDAVQWLEDRGVEYDWLVNLTAQDYPVTPIERIEEFLAGTSCDGLMRHWDALSPESPWSRRKVRARYWYRYRRLRAGYEPLLRALRPLTKILPLHFYLEYGPYLGVRCRRVPFGEGFRCHGGLAWFTLRREAVRYLRDFLAAHPEVEAHYRRTVAAEESLPQTVLVNSGRFEIAADDRRYVDYSRSVRGAPRVLTVADLPLLASGRYHFARKFELGVDRQVLDRIDRELLGIEPEGSA